MTEADLPPERDEPDAEWLRRKPTQVHKDDSSISIADLYCGCGGMTLGLVEAGRRTGCQVDVKWAIDYDLAATNVYRTNFPGAAVHSGDIMDVLPGLLGSPVTPVELELATAMGPLDVVIGGPPCQGHSDLNNHTRRRDPKNELYLRMARSAEVFRPLVVIIENVPPVQWDSSKVVERTTNFLRDIGYKAEGAVLRLVRLGVPQKRNRFILIASRTQSVDPGGLLDAMQETRTPERDVAWAIGDLVNVRGSSPLDQPSKMSAKNKSRAKYMFREGVFDLPNDQRPPCHRDKAHSYRSVYGRLRWGQPAQTITTGFTSMGQGRYVHPEHPRTLTPHEAARLQTFPDWFIWGDVRRTALARMIGNAVPPIMMVRLGEEMLTRLARSVTRRSA